MSKGGKAGSASGVRKSGARPAKGTREERLTKIAETSAARARGFEARSKGDARSDSTSRAAGFESFKRAIHHNRRATAATAALRKAR